jgi:hypothetical protein
MRGQLRGLDCTELGLQQLPSYVILSMYVLRKVLRNRLRELYSVRGKLNNRLHQLVHTSTILPYSVLRNVFQSGGWQAATGGWWLHLVQGR